MSKKDYTGVPTRREKENMDAPQEEYIDPEGIPSRSGSQKRGKTARRPGRDEAAQAAASADTAGAGVPHVGVERLPRGQRKALELDEYAEHETGRRRKRLQDEAAQEAGKPDPPGTRRPPRADQ